MKRRHQLVDETHSNLAPFRLLIVDKLKLDLRLGSEDSASIAQGNGFPLFGDTFHSREVVLGHSDHAHVMAWQVVEGNHYRSYLGNGM